MDGVTKNTENDAKQSNKSDQESSYDEYIKGDSLNIHNS